MTRARETSENARQAKAWVNFDGSASNSPFTEDNGSIRNSFNVTSVIDNGTGDYTINFDTAFSSVNYVWAGSCGEGYATTAINATPAVFNVRSAVVTTTTFRFYCTHSTSSNFGKLDRECITIVFYAGD